MRILADENVHMEIVLGLRRVHHEVLFVPDVGLAGQKDINILEYAEKHGLILLSGDKDFGGLVEFGRLWGRGRVILLRFRFLHPRQVVENIVEVLNREEENLSREEPLVIVLSESGYRVHRPATHREGFCLRLRQPPIHGDRSKQERRVP